MNYSEIKQKETKRQIKKKKKSIRKWSWTVSTLTNENWVISEELSSKHPEESTKQLVSSLSSSAKPITASDVGLFKANQSQEVFSPLSFSPPAYRCCLGSESLLKGDGTELTPPAGRFCFLLFLPETTLDMNRTSLLFLFSSFPQACHSLHPSFCCSPTASLHSMVRAECWLSYGTKSATHFKVLLMATFKPLNTLLCSSK